jgi:hypothetical protein
MTGANFSPSTAINQLEMWQAATIDRELGLAEGIGLNTMRVFLHQLVWERDPSDFKQRVGQYLALAEGLVTRDSVAGVMLGKLPPNMSGERKMVHKVSSVNCSSGVKCVWRSSLRSARMPKRPSGSMSALGQAPVVIKGAQRAHTAKCSLSCSHESQK